MTDQTPLTDQELAEIERRASAVGDLTDESDAPAQHAILRLVAEVRRLRAAVRDGDWVEVAADEIARWREWSDSEVGDKIEVTQAEIDSWPSATDTDVVTAIIRRHIAERVPDPLCPTCGRGLRWREGEPGLLGDRGGSWACVKRCAPS